MANAWVLVVGMHRSGTSATVGVLHELGLTLPEDLMTGRSDNHEHFESVSLSDANDSILGLLGGRWDAPPDLAPGWERRPDLVALQQMAGRSVAAAFPRPGVAVWKDPRNSLLLPYWAQLLSPVLGIVIPWREPMAVARSLEARDGMALAQGLDLWHRYNEAALAHSDGYGVLVVDYDELVEQPMTVATTAAAWLERIIPGRTLDQATVARAAQTVSSPLRHERAGHDDLPADCRQLRDRLAELHGAHPVLEARTATSDRTP